MAENSVRLLCRTKYYKLNTNRDYQEFGSSTSEEAGRAMYSPLQLNQVFSPYDYVSIMDHKTSSFGKLMERPKRKKL